MIKTIAGQVDLFSMLEVENNNFDNLVVIKSNEDSIISDVLDTKTNKITFEDKEANLSNKSFENDFHNSNDNEKEVDLIIKPIDKSFFNSKIELPFINYGLISELSDTMQKIVLNNKELACRIVYKIGGYLIIDTGEKSVYYNSEGKKEMELAPNLSLLPGDKILVVNKDLPINDIQLDVLKEFNVKTCIKRIGDCNLLLITDHTVAINKNGWVLDYKQKPIYNESLELFSLEDEDIVDNINSIEVKNIEDKKIDNTSVDISEKIYVEDINDNTIICDSECNSEYEFKIGDKVSGNYGESSFIGTIYSIYNNGFTVNVLWDNKITAFYYKSLTLVI